MLHFDTQEIEAILLSLKVGIFCILISFIPGVLIAYILARKKFWGKNLFETLINIPLVLPPVTIGYLLLSLFSREQYLGFYINKIFGMDISLNIFGLILASSLMGFPLLVRSIKNSYENIDNQIELRALTLGANPLRVFLTVTLPLSINGIISGLLLSFARSIGEFGATITFVGNIEGKTQTIPMLIYSYSQNPDSEQKINKLIILSIIISFVALFISDFLNKRKAF